MIHVSLFQGVRATREPLESGMARRAFLHRPASPPESSRRPMLIGLRQGRRGCGRAPQSRQIPALNRS